MARKPKPKPSEYSVMTYTGVPPLTTVSVKSEWDGPPWITGLPIGLEVPKPVEFELNPRYPGKLRAMYNSSIVLMSDELIAVLRGAGVENLEVFPAIIRDQARPEPITTYKAVNIVGLVACADLAASKYDPPDDPEELPLMFDSLCIDDSRAGGALMFRLKEAPNALVVHRTVREALEQSIKGMTFFEQGEWSG